MAVRYTSALRARFDAMAPRFVRAIEDTANAIDREIGEGAGATMIAGDAKTRGQGLRANAVNRKGEIKSGKAGHVADSIGKNLSPYLRIISGKALASLKLGGAAHVHVLQWNSELGLTLVTGSRVESAKGFPYLKAWALGIRGVRRDHITPAWMTMMQHKEKYSTKLAAACARIWNETK